MKTTVRHYDHEADYEKVSQFLVRTYDPAGVHVNWLQPRWEYMHHCSGIERVDLNSIGVWEAGGEIVAVVHPEHYMGTAYFQIDARCAALKREMLAHAAQHIAAAKEGRKTLRVFINDRDDEFQALAAEMGYAKGDAFEAMSHFVIPDPFPAISLPDGFRLESLADDNDVFKIQRLTWRGFNHGDEPPSEAIREQIPMQLAPNFRADLHIAVKASDGGYVSYCGMWYEPVHKIAYVEPVATDPDYRRMGLASAAVLEGIRRCGQQGATVAYVGSNQPLYLSIGFQQIYNRSAWRREWV